jgi:hypothetical protein
MGRDRPEPKPTKTTAERFLTWTKGIGLLLGGLVAMTGAVLGGIGTWKGGSAEDGVDQSWARARKAINSQGEALRRLHLRFVAFQARQEGETSASLRAKLDDLQRRHDALQAQLKAKTNGGRRARLEQLQKDLEVEKIRRARLEERLKARPRPAGRAAPAPNIQQLPTSWRKTAK